MKWSYLERKQKQYYGQILLRSSDFKSPHSLFFARLFLNRVSSCFFYLIPIFFYKCICPHKNIFRTSQGSLKKSIFTVFGMLFLKKMHFAIVICKEKGKTFLLSVKNTLMFWMNDAQLYFFVTNYLFSHCIHNQSAFI